MTASNNRAAPGACERRADVAATERALERLFRLAMGRRVHIRQSAAVGAVVLARRRRGLHPEGDEHVYSVTELVMPPGTGSMREGVAGIPEHVPGESGTKQLEPADPARGGW